MSYTNIDNSIMNYKISDGAFRLYFLLQSMCYNDKTECYPSQNYLAEKLNKSVRTIQRYIDELIDAGLLKKKRRGSISNLYVVMLKVLSQKVESVLDKVKEIRNKNSKAQGSAGVKYSSPKAKSSNWSVGDRAYDFHNLEAMLLGQANYDPSKLYNDK